ncbi:MAG TPA: hypothetical protein VM870_08685 [Pyrinomonadaceae bacterium]|nr:hypothetical protein [Pyrinomonadaceae bacterium]
MQVQHITEHFNPRRSPCVFAVFLFAATLILTGVREIAAVETRRKLPSPGSIIGDYVKARGGKKRCAAIRDATYEWTAAGEVRARVQKRAPVSLRTDETSPGGETNNAASARSAWTRGADGNLRTLTDAESLGAKLTAAIVASNLVEWKKLNLLARTVGVEAGETESAYVVEFSTREGAKARATFGAGSKLLLKLSDPWRAREIVFADYKLKDGVLEPHRMSISERGAAPTIYQLQSAQYNTNLAETIFDPPSEVAINIPDLLREVARNQKELDERVSEYTFTRKETEREINDRGELKRERVKVQEIYPVRGGGRVLKLISENGVALSPERTAKEEKRVAEELEKAERDYRKEQEKRERNAAEKIKRKGNETGVGKDGDDEFEGVSTFLRACEFVSPRREVFRERAAIVFDFRARPGFRPQNSGESLVSKLIGVVWIDPEDKQVMRLEARLADGFKIGGGLLASVRSGSAFAFEQTRMADGVWLPRMAQINASVKVLLLAGLRLDATREYSDYKKFNTQTGDAKLNEVKQ